MFIEVLIRLMRIIGCILLFCLPFFVFASGETISFSEIPSGGLSVISGMGYYEDKDQVLDISSIQEIPREAFRKFNKEKIFSNSDYHYWLRLDLKYSGDSLVNAMLLHQDFKNAQFYYQDNDLWKELDITVYRKKKSAFFQLDYIPLTFRPGQISTFYIRSQRVFHHKNEPDLNHYTLCSEKDAWSRLYYSLDAEIGVFFWRSGCLGIFAFLCLFTLVQFFQNKDKSYLWYSIYHATILFAYLWRYGRFFQTAFTPLIPEWYKVVNVSAFYLSIIAYSFFVISFLNPRKKEEEDFAKRLMLAIYVIFGFLVIDLGLKYFGYYNLSKEIYGWTKLVMIFLYGYILWSAFKLKFTAFHYIIAGAMTLVLFGILTSLNNGWLIDLLGLEVVQNEFWKLPFSPMVAGFLLEALFFAVALGVKSKQIIEDRNEARQIIFLTKEENVLLKQELNANKLISDEQETRLEDASNGNHNAQKLVLPVREGYEIIKTEDILYCAADGNMCRIYLNGGKSLMLSKTLKEICEKLPHETFIRIHNSHTVNLDHVARYIKGEGGVVILSNKEELKVSRSRKDELLKRLEGS